MFHKLNHLHLLFNMSDGSEVDAVVWTLHTGVNQVGWRRLRLRGNKLNEWLSYTLRWSSGVYDMDVTGILPSDRRCWDGDRRGML